MGTWGTKLARSRDAGRVVVTGRKAGKGAQLTGCKVDEERGRRAQRWRGVRLVGVRDKRRSEHAGLAGLRG